MIGRSRVNESKPRNRGAFVFIPLALVLAFACAKSEQPANPSGARAVARKKAPKPKPPEPGEVAVGAMMPAYHAQFLDGKEFDLSAQKGSVVLVNVWATWCGPCRFEIPELEKMHKDFGARGFKVIGISVDDTGADSVKEFVTEKKMTYPIVIDAEGKIANLMQTSILPTTVLIDKSGKVVWKQYGAISSGDMSLLKALEAALAST